jgi:hypothetical protein
MPWLRCVSEAIGGAAAALSVRIVGAFKKVQKILYARVINALMTR